MLVFGLLAGSSVARFWMMVASWAGGMAAPSCLVLPYFHQYVSGVGVPVEGAVGLELVAGHRMRILDGVAGRAVAAADVVARIGQAQPGRSRREQRVDQRRAGRIGPAAHAIGPPRQGGAEAFE